MERHQSAPWRFGVSSVALAGLLVATSLAEADVIAQWRFDEEAGATIAADSVGGQDGMLHGSTGFVEGGISGNALSLSIAGDGYVTMGDAFAFAGGDFSIVVWVKTDAGDQTPDYLILARHRATYVAGYIIGMNQNGTYGATDKAWFYQSVSPGGEVISNKAVNDGAWHQIAVSYHAGGLVELYIDGTPMDNSKAASPIVYVDAPFLIGAIDWWGTPKGAFNGWVDEVQLYDHAIGPCEVLYVYEHPGEVAPEADPCPPDVNDDLVVDVLDLLGILGAWGPCDHCAEDVNCDLVVDVLDLLEVLGAWGPC